VCPTEAIRVTGRRSVIMEDRCIDCGECFRVCHQHAWHAMADPLERMGDFDISIALVPPSFYAQFGPEVEPEHVVSALKSVGFHDVFDAAYAKEAMTRAYRVFMKTEKWEAPLISPACPAVVRLLQVSYPDLLGHIVPMDSPIEIAAKMAKQESGAWSDCSNRRVGCFFITPCPARVTAIKQPVGGRRSYVDGAFSMSDIFGLVFKKLDPRRSEKIEKMATGSGISWARSGGEALSLGTKKVLAVDGIHAVITVLHEIERGKLRDIEFIEARACTGGCIGGPLTVENPFIARVRNRMLSEHRRAKSLAVPVEWVEENYPKGYFHLAGTIPPRDVLRMDSTVEGALDRLKRMEALLQELPGYDCGACGSPTCRTYAQDVICGLAGDDRCAFRSQADSPDSGERKIRITCRQLAERLGLDIAVDSESLDDEVNGCCCSDMLSDVMAAAGRGDIWVTVQTHPNIVAVASVTGVSAILITSDRKPEDRTLVSARTHGVPILVTAKSSFEVAGRLWSVLNQ